MSMKNAYTESGRRMAEGVNQSNALVRQLNEHKGYLEAKLPQLEKWITGGVDPRALVRFAMLDLSAPKADKLRACSKESIYTSLLACAVTGLEPGALKGEAYIVPFGGKAQFMAGWRGLVKQAKRSREVMTINPQVVFEHDVFELDLGGGTPPVHRPVLRGDRGAIIGAYAVAKLLGSRDSIVSYDVEWMDRADLDAVKAVATGRGMSDAWKDWGDQMWRKSPIRRLAKRLPLGHDYYVGLAVEQAQEEGKRSDRDVLDIVTDGEASRTEAAAGMAASMREQVEDAHEVTPEEAAEIARQEREGA